MAKTLSSKALRAPKLDGTIIAGALICALLAAAFGYWRMGPGRAITADDFAFDKLSLDKKKLESQRQRKYAPANLQSVQDEWQELVRAARVANRAQFGHTSQEELLTQSATVRIWANEVLVGSGLESFVVTGEPIFRECKAGLEALLGAVQSGALSLEEAKANPPEDAFRPYRENCGNLLPTLLARGLVTERGTWANDLAPEVADLMNRYRWAHIIHDQKDPWVQLTEEGSRLFARWRVEQADGYSYRERRKFLNDLASQFPDYNAEYAAGVVAFQHGEFDVALEHFDRLAQSAPRSQFPEYAEFVRHKVRSSPGGDDSGPGKKNAAAAKKSN